jgi:hypothetical protein
MKKDYNRNLHKFVNALERIDVEKIYLQAVKELSEMALDLNRFQLYAEGIDSTERSLGKYSESTVARKKAKGDEYAHITLRDTGSFQDKFFLDTKQIPVFIDSRDNKTGILEQKYGPKILWLTPSNTEEFKIEVMKLFRQKIHNKIEDAKQKILQ